MGRGRSTTGRPTGTTAREWPDDVTAEEYDALFVQISRETFAFAPDAPVNWWTMRIRKILSEAKALKRRA